MILSGCCHVLRLRVSLVTVLEFVTLKMSALTVERVRPEPQHLADAQIELIQALAVQLTRLHDVDRGGSRVVDAAGHIAADRRCDQRIRRLPDGREAFEAWDALQRGADLNVRLRDRVAREELEL